MAPSKNPVGIIGAGTMGAGIAQVAATSGWTVQLMDVDAPTVRKAITKIKKRLGRLKEKGILTPDQHDETIAQLKVATKPTDLKDCDLVVEAIVEDFDTKTKLLSGLLPELSPGTVIATNTSSFSITKLGEAINRSERFVGLHFFNPAPLMPLVEVIHGKKSSKEAINRAALIAEAWGKTVVHCNDTPGFIVNRVARPFYLESFRILEDGYANIEEIDKAMKDLGNFRMGPFELTDLIGQDVNTATTLSVWEQLGKPVRLKPSTLQTNMVSDGHLGRKTDQGAYHHDVDPPTIALEVKQQILAMPDRLREVVEAFVNRSTNQSGPPQKQYVFARILVAIINEAAWALSDQIASPEDIDTALKLGTNYPKGPLEWAEEIGYATCGELLDALNDTVDDNRFEAPEILKSKV